MKDTADQSCDMPQDLIICPGSCLASGSFDLMVDGSFQEISLLFKEVKASMKKLMMFLILMAHGTSSWVIMVIAALTRTFIVKETFLLTSRYLKTWKLCQGSTKYMASRTCLMGLMDL